MSRRTRVVHVVVAGSIGGAERLLIDLASRPEASGADHSIALMTPNPKLRARFEAAGLRLRDRGPVRADPLAYLWRAFGPLDVDWLARILREEDADIVHVHTYASHILGVRAARRCALPVLRTEHGVAHYSDPSCAPGRAWALRNTDMLVAVSDYVGGVVAAQQGAGRDRIRVVRNGVDAAYFAPQPPPHAASPDAPFAFAVVCRLEAWKRVDWVIRGAARVPGIRLAIAGSGSEERRLQRLARRLGVADRVAFLGWQADPRPVLAACHAAVNCSRNEPLGLSVLEAMAMQRPVAAVAAGGVPEIVRHGQTGWLAADAPDGLAACLAEASADRARAASFGVAARKFVEREAGIEAMCGGYAGAYAELLDTSGKARPAFSGKRSKKLL